MTVDTTQRNQMKLAYEGIIKLLHMIYGKSVYEAKSVVFSLNKEGVVVTTIFDSLGKSEQIENFLLSRDAGFCMGILADMYQEFGTDNRITIGPALEIAFLSSSQNTTEIFFFNTNPKRCTYTFNKAFQAAVNAGGEILEFKRNNDCINIGYTKNGEYFPIFNRPLEDWDNLRKCVEGITGTDKLGPYSKFRHNNQRFLCTLNPETEHGNSIVLQIKPIDEKGIRLIELGLRLKDLKEKDPFRNTFTDYILPRAIFDKTPSITIRRAVEKREFRNEHFVVSEFAAQPNKPQGPIVEKIYFQLVLWGHILTEITNLAEIDLVAGQSDGEFSFDGVQAKVTILNEEFIETKIDLTYPA